MLNQRQWNRTKNFYFLYSWAKLFFSQLNGSYLEAIRNNGSKWEGHTHKYATSWILIRLYHSKLLVSYSILLKYTGNQFFQHSKALTYYFFKYKFIYSNWRLITLLYCIGFAIHQHESATGIHVFPTLNASPSSLPAIRLGLLSAPAPSIQYHASNLNWWFISYMILYMLSFKPAFWLSSFTFIKKLFGSSSLSSMRVVSFAYLRLLIFLLAILIPACASSSPAFLMMYSA